MALARDIIKVLSGTVDMIPTKDNSGVRLGFTIPIEITNPQNPNPSIERNVVDNISTHPNESESINQLLYDSNKPRADSIHVSSVRSNMTTLLTNPLTAVTSTVTSSKTPRGHTILKHVEENRYEDSGGMSMEALDNFPQDHHQVIAGSSELYLNHIPDFSGVYETREYIEMPQTMSVKDEYGDKITAPGTYSTIKLRKSTLSQEEICDHYSPPVKKIFTNSHIDSNIPPYESRLGPDGPSLESDITMTGPNSMTVFDIESRIIQPSSRKWSINSIQSKDLYSAPSSMNISASGVLNANTSSNASASTTPRKTSNAVIDPNLRKFLLVDGKKGI